VYPGAATAAPANARPSRLDTLVPVKFPSKPQGPTPVRDPTLELSVIDRVQDLLEDWARGQTHSDQIVTSNPWFGPEPPECPGEFRHPGRNGRGYGRIADRKEQPCLFERVPLVARGPLLLCNGHLIPRTRKRLKIDQGISKALFILIAQAKGGPPTGHQLRDLDRLEFQTSI